MRSNRFACGHGEANFESSGFHLEPKGRSFCANAQIGDLATQLRAHGVIGKRFTHPIKKGKSNLALRKDNYANHVR